MRPAGADFLQLDPSTAPVRGVTGWLTDHLRRGIADGRLPPGTRLPATRTLATDLGVARGVVVEAYQRITDEGLLGARTGVGTVVLDVPLAPDGATPPPPATRRSEPRLPIPTSHWPEVIDLDLSPGVPDLTAFPRAAWLRAERAVLDAAAPGDLGYGDPRGSATLRTELARWLARTRGVNTDPDGILVVAGVAQSLALLAKVLPGHGYAGFAMEDPGSRGAREQLAHWGIQPVGVPVDDEGIQVDALTRTGLGVAVVTPAHQFPTGVVLSPSRRRALLEWAREDRLVVEDDYDAEHRYDRAPVRALHPAAPESVIHTGSTSKSLAPGLRLGWLIPPTRLFEDLVDARHATDLGSPAIPQLVLAHLLATGAYDRHLRLVSVRHRARRDAMLEALHEYLPAARIEGVAAGLHLLIALPDLPDDTDDTELAARCRSTGVAVHPLSWHRQAPGPPGLVLGYAAHPPDRITEAVERIGRAVR